ncbi:hypothetical protein F383_38686 [Gossypium arboreum]|uniref:Uncharacterized protein n=1 Tax=Gossypium arboreum TaxID=29729 RepID=A0A0B0MGP2_GOSAR|nr:hypothetical protein F383_38686 [Gossypium arboreum]
MPYSNYGLVLAFVYLSRCRVPDRSYIDTCNRADTCPRHVLH